VPSEGSITGLIGGMRLGDDDAVRRIWQHYSPRLAALARQRLPVWLRRVVDGDDVANSAMFTLMTGLREGRFHDVEDRDDLWALLACITVRKAINQIKSATRRKRPPHSAVEPLDEGFAAPEPAPDLGLMAAERFDNLIDRLRAKDEILETIALCRFEGDSIEEIARWLGCSRHRVMRKLELIRMTLKTEGP
jgi:DNA-directed RNA polymerase specialized sigma24 family protein